MTASQENEPDPIRWRLVLLWSLLVPVAHWAQPGWGWDDVDSALLDLALPFQPLALILLAAPLVGKQWLRAGWGKRPGRRDLAIGLAGGLAGCLCMNITGRLVLGSLAEQPDLFRGSWWWMILTLGALGPIAEELEFRGAVWVAAHRVLGGPIPTLLFTSAVFAILHHPGSLGLAAGYGAFGLIMGCTRICSNNVVAPALAHVTCNVGIISYALLH